MGQLFILHKKKSLVSFIYVYYHHPIGNIFYCSSSSNKGAALIWGLAPFGKEACFLAAACLRRKAAGTNPINSFWRSLNCGSAEIVTGLGSKWVVGSDETVVGW